MLLSWYVGETYHWRNGSQLSLCPFPMPSTFSSANGRSSAKYCIDERAIEIDYWYLCSGQSHSDYTVKYVKNCKHKDEDMELMDAIR